MNHPKREDWIPYLYGEVTTETQRDLKAHLNDCPECRAQVRGWQQSMNRLDGWKLSKARRQDFWAPPIFKWAAAIAFVALGFLAGNLIASKPDMKALRTTLAAELHQDLKPIVREEVNRSAEATLAQALEQNAKAIAACVASLDTKRGQDYHEIHAALLVLKEQLDTVAMNTGASFRQAEQKFLQLVDYKQPQNPSTQP